MGNFAEVYLTEGSQHSKNSRASYKTGLKYRVHLLKLQWENCPKLMLSIFCSVATQHDTCPVCRKSLNGEDSSSQPPSESPSLSMDPRTQERWSFWDTHLSHPSVLLAYIQQHTEKTERFSLSSFHLCCSHNHLSLIFFVFLFSILMPFSSTMYTDIRTDVLTVTWGLLDLFFFFFLPNNKPA